MIVLDELGREAQFGQGAPVVAFEEEAAAVAEDFRFYDPDIGDGGGNLLHQECTRSLSRPSRYWP